MSVELEPKNTECFSIGVANGTWFTLLDKAGLGTILPIEYNNDEISATDAQANQCASLLEKWTPPDDWFCRGKELYGRNMFIEFFRECGGFTTR